MAQTTDVQKFHVSESLKKIRNAYGNGMDGMLLGMSTEHPGLRGHFLGGVRDDGVWPMGSAYLKLDGRELSCSLALRDLELEARYHSDDWEGMWETIEHDLIEGTVDWCLDYSGRERLKRKMIIE